MPSSYRIVGRIGSGGMAEVFLAKMIGAAGFEKTVAIKYVLPRFTKDPRFSAQLIQEAKLATRLNHANIVSVLDLGQSGHRYFVVMEYVDGSDLESAMLASLEKGPPLPASLACFITRQLLWGLAYVHEKSDDQGLPMNLVHRDVSPANIMLSRAGEVKLTDFGIAKARNHNLLTDAGVIRGKASYMSPEQTAGATLDQRSDLFSLGVVLYEMLTHKRLFAEDNAWKVMQQVQQADVPPPSQLQPAVPAALDRWMQQALAKDPQQRFANARIMGAALDHAIDSEHLRATPEDLSRWLQAVQPYKTLEPCTDTDQMLVIEAAESQLPAVGSGTKAIGLPASTDKANPVPSRRFQTWFIAAAVLALAVVGLRFGTSSKHEEPDLDGVFMVDAGQATAAGDQASFDSGEADAAAGKSDPGSPEQGATPQDPAPAKAPRGEATLYINSEPWSRILVDGKDIGVTTPTVAGLRLPVGAYRITLHNPALELSYSFEINLKKDEVIKRFVDLRRQGTQH